MKRAKKNVYRCKSKSTVALAAVVAVECMESRLLMSSTIGWDFGAGTPAATHDIGAADGFTEAGFGIGNAFGTIATPINASSASSGYPGASKSENIGNAVKASTSLDTSVAGYYTVTLTPADGDKIEINGLTFGMRSTSTGPQDFTLRSSIDGFSSDLATGSIANNSTWFLEAPTVAVVDGAVGAPVELRLYLWGGVGNASSGTENNRIDDVTLTATAVPSSSGTQSVSLAAATENVNEGAGTATITVNREGTSTGDVSGDLSVPYSTSDGSALAGTNYTTSDSSFTIPAGQVSGTFTVPILPVYPQGGDKSFTVTLGTPTLSGQSAGVTAVLGAPVSETITIQDSAETFALSTDQYVVNDTDGTAEISVVRSGFSDNPATVLYHTSDDSGVSGTDYAGTDNGMVNFAAGQLVADISVPVSAVSNNKDFAVTLDSATPTNGDYASFGATVAATETIVHVAAPAAGTVSLTSSASAVSDIETSGYFSSAYAPVVGDVKAGTGSFSFLAYEVLEFSPSTTPSVYPPMGTTINDEGLSNLSIQMFNTDASGADNYSGHVGNFNIYFIPDSDGVTATSGLKFNAVSALPGGLDAAQFSAAPVLLGTFSFNNTAGYDTYTPATIPDAVESALVADLNSGTSFRFALTPQTSGTGSIAVDWSGIFAGESPSISFSAAETTTKTLETISFQSPAYSESENGPATLITLTRSGTDISDSATVTFTTSDDNALAGTNYTAASETVTFDPGSDTATFSVPAIAVANQGGDKFLTLTLGNPQTLGATTIATLGSQTTAILTIADSSAAPTEMLTPTIAGAADVEAKGPYNDTEIKATDLFSAFPSYGVLDFSNSAPINPVTAINAITFTITNEPTVAAGAVDFYLVADTSSNIMPASPQAANPHFYDNTQGIEGIGTQFGTPMLLGKYNLTDTTGGDTLTIPLIDFSPATASALMGFLNGGSSLRIVVTPEDSSVDADWDSTSAAISINVQEGSTLPSLPSWISGSAATWNAASDTLEVTGPGVTINEDPNADSETLGGSPVTNPNIVVDAGQTLHIKPSSTPSSSGSPAYTVPTSGQLVHLGGISLGNGANTIVDSLGANRSASNHVVLVVGTGAAAPTFDVASGKLDMTDNDLIIHNGNLAAVQADAAIGRNVAPGGVFDGPWNGGGLSSSAANAAFIANGSSEVTVLAVVQNSEQLLGQLPAWVVGSKSETLSGSDIIVKYTYNGDFALEGFVGDDSSTIFALNYDPNEGTGHDWAGGDANGDGTADDTDATIFSIFYGNGTAGSALPQL